MTNLLTVTAFLVVAAVIPALGQQDQARLEGVVRDPAGAVVAGATVTARSAALGIERTATTSEDGLYSMPQLRPGTYVVTVVNAGFNDTQVNDLVVGAGQVRTLDIDLATQGVSTDVTIVAGTEGATIDTSSNRLGVNVTAREVAELPVNGRNFSQLQLLTPGATNTGTGNFNEVRFNARSNEQNQTRLDGIELSHL
ncbi:MAG: carboxypeptidase-like regulatory domain-containing protein [Pyrinomonadaceae bacterium]